jgi:hypothetical protein
MAGLGKATQLWYQALSGNMLHDQQPQAVQTPLQVLQSFLHLVSFLDLHVSIHDFKALELLELLSPSSLKSSQ